MKAEEYLDDSFKMRDAGAWQSCRLTSNVLVQEDIIRQIRSRQYLGPIFEGHPAASPIHLSHVVNWFKVFRPVFTSKRPTYRARGYQNVAVEEPNRTWLAIVAGSVSWPSNPLLSCS